MVYLFTPNNWPVVSDLALLNAAKSHSYICSAASSARAIVSREREREREEPHTALNGRINYVASPCIGLVVPTAKSFRTDG